jgi:glycosyltransferase involved in cell wall biosynthesis
MVLFMVGRVLMLLSNEFRPDPRVLKEALALKDGGFKVTILSWNRERKRAREEEHSSVQIRRINTGMVTGMASLLRNYPLFLLGLLREARLQAFDAVHSHDLDTLLPGILISRLHGVPLVYDAHERYAKMIAVDVPPIVSKTVERIERRLIGSADVVITINDVMAGYFQPYAEAKVLVIANCIDLPDASSVKRHTRSDFIILLYTGTFEPQRYIEETIEVVKKMEGCEYWLAGSGRLQKQIEGASAGGNRIKFLGYLPHSEMLKKMVESDVILLLVDPRNENYRMGSANKMGEAMAFGLPLITSKGTLSGDIIERIDCGLVIDWSEDNFQDAVKKLRDPRLRNEMGARGRQAAEKELNWGVMKERLLVSYGQLLKKRKLLQEHERLRS